MILVLLSNSLDTSQKTLCREDGEKWLDSEYSLKIKSTGLGVGCEMKLKNDSKVLV